MEVKLHELRAGSPHVNRSELLVGGSVYPVGCGVHGKRSEPGDRVHRLKQGLLVCLATLAIGTVVWRLVPRHNASASFDASQKNQKLVVPKGAGAESIAATVGDPKRIAARDFGRVVYPYSLIPGGVHGPEELRLVSARDPLVATHFAGFAYERATVVRLQEPKLVYLAYRFKDRVYWTKKKVRLVAGETLITDGKITARTRCANPISESAQTPHSPDEPAAEKFEKPIGGDDGTAARIAYPSRDEAALLSRPLLAGLVPADPLVVAPPVPVAPVVPAAKGWFIPPLIPPILGGSSSSSTPALPPGVTPEPSTILLISTGLAGIYVRYKKNSKQ